MIVGGILLTCGALSDPVLFDTACDAMHIITVYAPVFLHNHTNSILSDRIQGDGLLDTKGQLSLAILSWAIP